jgi:hypothetical protein
MNAFLSVVRRSNLCYNGFVASNIKEQNHGTYIRRNFIT